MYWFWTHFFYLCISILNIFDFFFAPSSIFNFIFLLLLLLVILFYYYFIFLIFLYFIIIILLFFLSPHFLPQNPKFPPPPFPSLLPSLLFSFSLHSSFFNFETDEVYVQMTLQPLSPVSCLLLIQLDFWFFVFQFCFNCLKWAFL